MNERETTLQAIAEDAITAWRGEDDVEDGPDKRYRSARTRATLWARLKAVEESAPSPAPLRVQEPSETNWEQEARRLLWLNHGCPVTHLYGDDGEMQCAGTAHAGVWDFKRTPWEELTHVLLVARLTAAPSVPPERETALRAALDGLLTHYVRLVESGDAGFWNAETEPVVIAARAALATESHD